MRLDRRSFAPLKQQVMIDAIRHWACTHAGRLIGVEMPAIPLILLNRLPDILVMLDFDTFVVF